MDLDDITSPQPIFPGGSNATATIPLLDNENVAPDVPIMTDPDVTIAEDRQDPSSIPIESHGAKTEPPTSTSGTPVAATVTVVDDSIIEPDQALPVDPDMQAEPLEEPPSETHVGNPDSNVLMTGPAVEEANVSAMSQSSAPAVSQPTLPLGIPAGVDLQALLNSFASAAPIPSDSQQSEASQPALSTATAAPVVAQSAPSKPVAPWQAQRPVPSPTAPANDVAASVQHTDDAAYEQFLIDEKRIMGNTAPHEFEPGSRLFVGNLSIETTSKREIFMIFRKYGKLAQVSLKSTYGFVQYLTARECKHAMDGEQGIEVGSRKLHLEVSKPQPARGAAANAATSRRRSRSPVRRSEGRSYGDRKEAHDSFGRSPPPRRNSPGRYHTPYDGHYSNRRSPSPRRYAPPPPPEETPLPPRYGSQIPEIQIVVLDEADRAYIHWVETSIRQSGLKVESLFLSPRLGLPVVVRQMVKEGVLAIVQCNRQLQMTNRVTLQVFDRSQGASSVRFDEYANLDMATAVGLLKRTQQQAVALPPAPPQQANLAAMIAQMDPASLQQVIGALSQQQNQQGQQPGGYPGSYPYRR